MEINKIYPDYCRMLYAQRVNAEQQKQQAHNGNTDNKINSPPQNIYCGANNDVFETKKSTLTASQFNPVIMPCNNIYAQAPPATNPQKDFEPIKAKEPSFLEQIKSKKGKAVLNALGIIPPVRRDISATDKFEEGNNVGTALQIAMGLANLPGDITQMGLAVRDGKEGFKALFGKGLKTIPKKEYFRECSFFRSTFLEKYMEPILVKYPWLENLDKSLSGTKFGERVRNLFNIGIEDVQNIAGVTKNSGEIATVKFASKGLKQVIGGSLLRLSPLALITSAITEVPALVNSITKTEGTALDKTKAFGKQLLKSASFVGIVNAGIAIGGAAFALTPFGAAAELLGLAIGSAAGITAARVVNKGVDNIFKTKEPKL